MNNINVVLGGFVKNKITNQYELLFQSEIGSAMLVRNRAVETATDRNRFNKEGLEIYDTEDVVVKSRQQIVTYSSWQNYGEAPAPVERSFFVKTPLGDLRVKSKYTVDEAQDWPGVYIDLIDPETNEEILLACVEYDPSEEKILTTAYDAGCDAPMTSHHHELTCEEEK